ncbi:MAG TPA: hypothetical protein VF144_00890 [Chitinophagaceae bacterium]
MRKFSWLLAIAIPILIVSCQKDSKELPAEDEIVTGTTGNGAPSGAHYNLNIIGVPKDKNPDFSGGNGRRIFVPLVGKTKILLKEGEFDVLDANGTDGTAAFQLPEPDAGDDGVTDYSVFVRGLGKPGGSALMYSCYFDQQTATEYCSTGEQFTVEIGAHGNNNKFTNVTNQLLYVWADTDGDGDLDRTELFADPLDEYYWYYDNNGLKLAQLRFYPNVGTEVWADPE